MRNYILEYLNKNTNFKFKLCGLNRYLQIMIEPGAEIGNNIISEWCKELDCYSEISCVHSDLMNGYCLMIELYK